MSDDLNAVDAARSIMTTDRYPKVEKGRRASWPSPLGHGHALLKLPGAALPCRPSFNTFQLCVLFGLLPPQCRGETVRIRPPSDDFDPDDSGEKFRIVGIAKVTVQERVEIPALSSCVMCSLLVLGRGDDRAPPSHHARVPLYRPGPPPRYHAYVGRGTGHASPL